MLCDLAEVCLCSAEEDLVLDRLIQLGLVHERHDAALVVRARGLVVDRHETVPLEVRNGRDRCVDWQLAVVDTETVAVGPFSTIRV